MKINESILREYVNNVVKSIMLTYGKGGRVVKK